MKRFEPRTWRPIAEKPREREKRQEDDLDARLVVERMLDEGCPNAQPIVPDESSQTERSGCSNLGEMASPRP